MNLLQEKRSLVELARRFGQEPAADLLAEILVLEREEQQRLQRESAIRERIAGDLTEIFNLGVKHELVPLQSSQEEIHEHTITPQSTNTSNDLAATVGVRFDSTPATPTAQPTIAQRVAQAISESGVVAPEPVLAQPQKDLEREIKYLREWVSRIAATGPGGGAAQVYNLDMPTKLITTSSYSIGRKDYYIGVNYAGRSFITLPTQNLGSGRDVIIKDESGRCEAFPITVIGNVDNDPDGFILQINNGAIHLIYRDGWRIV